MPLILGAQSAAAAAAVVSNSCRFNKPDTDEFTRTLGTPTDNEKWTLSVWIKRGNLGSAMAIADAASSGTQYTEIYFTSGDAISWDEYQSGYVGRLVTDRVFRDTNAWYHIVFVWDSGNASATDRMRLYINGTEETSFSTDTNPSINENSLFNSAVAHSIGSISPEGGTWYYDGYMSEVVLIDGQALTPTSFGEFDSDSPTIWKPIAVSGLTFGDNGFYLDFEDSADLGADVSGNSNDFTPVNIAAVDQSQDTPINNFATLNPLENYYNGATFSNGNNTVGASGSNYSWNGGTQLMTSGKWYFEVLPGAAVDMMIGISGNQPVSSTQVLGNKLYQWGFNSDNAKYQNNAVDSAVYSDTWDSGDYMGVYLDLDNNKLYLGKNGVIQNSGTGVTITAPSAFTGTHYGGYVFAVGDYTTSSGIFDCNFGNGCFGNTVITSAEADANGYGLFKYSPSAGSFDGSSKDFLALCTKNLGSDGG
jgi:hypothetical protein